MSMEQPISGLEKAERIPQGTTYVTSMGDGSGTKNITQELLTKEVGKGLNLGNLLELMTENKASIVEAINELKGLVDDMDILGTPEEIEANTEEGKAAGALAVKEMVSELNNNLSNLNDSLVDAMMPNYGSGYSISSGFVAPVSGWITYDMISMGGTSIVYINAKRVSSVGQTLSNASLVEIGGIAPIAKGQTVTSSGSIQSMIFYPCIGL